MRPLLEIVRLEFRALVRSRALAILAVVSLAWMFAMPVLVKGDGTAEGARMMFVRYSLGGVFAFTLVSLVAAGAGSLAKDRSAKRLQLTAVRPVSPFAVAFGRFIALTASGAAVLALAAVVVLCRTDVSRVCDHVLAPVMESPRAEAERMYAIYMQDPDTPKAVREAKKSDVVRILEQKAAEHYQTIGTNETAAWTFRMPDRVPGAAVRLRFTDAYDMREDVFGTFRIGGFSGAVSNVTKSVLAVPLAGTRGTGSELVFRNEGGRPLLLRPRRDIHLLVAADSFAANLFRAWLELVSVLGLAVAFAVFLGAGLGRSASVFTAVTVLVLSVVSPAVVEQCPYEIDTARGDLVGLALTRFAVTATQPMNAVSPLERLSSDECVEWPETVRTLLADLVLLPLAFAFLAAVVMPRKEDGM